MILYQKLTSAFHNSEKEWQKNIIILCFAQFIAMVGMSACVPFLPLFIRELGVTNQSDAKFWSGLVFAGPFMLSIIATPFWGMLGDKYGRKPMLIRAVMGLALAMGLMGFAQSVEQLFVFRVLQGLLSGFMAAVLGFISANTPKEKSGYSIGLFQSSVAAGNIVGPLIGGVLSDIYGVRPVFFIVAALCFLAGLLVIFFIKEKNKGVDNERKVSMLENIKFIFKSKFLLMLIILIVMVQAGFYITNPIFVLFIEHLEAPKEYLSSITGILIGIMGVVYVVLSPKWGKTIDKRDFRKILFATIFISGIIQILHFFSPNYKFIFPLRLGLGIVSSAIIPTLYTLLNKEVPEVIKGGIMGFASSANIFGTLIGYLLCSTISPNIEISYIFLISGIMLLFTSLLSTAIKKI